MKVLEEIKETHFMTNNYFSKTVPFTRYSQDMRQCQRGHRPRRSNTIWRKEGATECSMINSKHVQSKYLAFIAVVLHEVRLILKNKFCGQI